MHEFGVQQTKPNGPNKQNNTQGNFLCEPIFHRKVLEKVLKQELEILKNIRKERTKMFDKASSYLYLFLKSGPFLRYVNFWSVGRHQQVGPLSVSLSNPV